MVKSRRYLYLTLFVIVAIGVWTAYWFTLASQVRERARAFIDQQTAGGVEIAFTNFDVGGYPYRIEATVDNLTISMPRQPGKPAFAVPRLVVLGLPWNPNLVVARIEGDAVTRWTDARNEEQRATYRAESTGLSVGLEGGQPKRFALSMDRPRLESSLLAGPVSAKVFEIHARLLDGGPVPASDGAAGNTPTAPLSMELALDGEAVVLPPLPDAVLGNEITSFGYTVGLAGPLPRYLPGTAPRDMIGAWAQAGGTIELTRAETRWGSLNSTMTGSFSVDGEMRLLGAMSGRVGGLEPLIDGAVAQGRMNPGQAQSIKKALNAIGFITRDAEGRVPFALTFQDGKVSMGPVQVGELRPLF